jgi:ribosomal protein S18 acetylase RimI-like enzyme
MILRPAHIDDTPAIARLGRESFMVKFGHLYSAEDVETFLKQVYSEGSVAQEIRDPGVVHCLAFNGPEGPLTGFCKLRAVSNFAHLSHGQSPIELGQLYTDPNRTGEGIGAALMGWALQEARQLGCDAIQLSVFSENDGAQRFYQRYGFAKIADIDFWVGNHRDHEFLYELLL